MRMTWPDVFVVAPLTLAWGMMGTPTIKEYDAVLTSGKSSPASPVDPEKERSYLCSKNTVRVLWAKK